MNFKSFLSNMLNYQKNNKYNYTLSETQVSNNIVTEEKNDKKVSEKLQDNIDYLTVKYNALINSDINIRNINIYAKGKQYSGMLFYIDGMVDSDMVNNYILKPLMLKNKTNSETTNDSMVVTNKDDLKKRQSNLSTLENIIHNTLLPQNSIKTSDDFLEIISCINSGFTALFVDTLSDCFCIEAKGFEKRSIEKPNNEVVIRGPQEAFVENIRTNTSMLRRIINNENLVIEQCTVGKITQTKVAVCYMSNITNEDLVNEVKYRINNLDIDAITSSGNLEHLIEDDDYSIFPQLLITERSDRASANILDGRVVVLINGAPFALVAPAVFIDFLSSPEDSNLKHQYSNLVRFMRSIAFIIAVFMPSFYVAVTTYHQELIPSDLIFAISAGRKAIPFPVIFEILIMEVSFELLREASLRIPTPMGSTVGIIGGLILGEAAVSASLVSPLLIIIVAITGICSFAIPDYSLSFALRLFRFVYIVLAYMAGFLGLSLGIFVQLISLCNLKSFGVSYFSPYVPSGNKDTLNKFYINPIWQRNKRSNFLNTKKPDFEGHISMKWKKKQK